MIMIMNRQYTKAAQKLSVNNGVFPFPLADFNRKLLNFSLFTISFLVTQSEQDKCCILLVKLQQRSGDFLWVHVVLQVKDATDTPRQLIVATNQILR